MRLASASRWRYLLGVLGCRVRLVLALAAAFAAFECWLALKGPRDAATRDVVGVSRQLARIGEVSVASTA